MLLAVLVLRQADFGIRTTHGLASIAGIYAILMAGPRLANMVSPVPAFFVNVVCIMLLMILGCHNVIMYNHSTFVLGYLLLFGYDVSGHAYILRLEGLLVGMILCMIIFYKNQKNRPYRRKFFSSVPGIQHSFRTQQMVYQADIHRIIGDTHHVPARTSKSYVGRYRMYVRVSSVYK